MTCLDDMTLLSVLNKMPAMVYISDNSTKTIRWCNLYMEKLTGYTLDQIRSLGIEFFRRVMHPSGFSKAVEAQQHFQDGKEMFSGFCRIRPLLAKEWMWLYGIAVPFSKDDDGNIKEVICVFQEIDCMNTPSQFDWVVQSLGQKMLNEYLSPLSQKEREVFQHMLLREDNCTIADKLNISITTVKTHKKHIREKLGTDRLRRLLALLTDI